MKQLSSSSSSSFELLDVRIQRWIWSQNWTELRDIQELAIPLILDAKQDIIIAAATATGKTEAAFLPILSRMLKDKDKDKDEGNKSLTICISPLKALINDQFARLELLCEQLEMPICPWHGDITSSIKSRFIKQAEGVLLITPESLEAILCNKGFSAAQIFTHLKYFVVDELHAFIGSERGKQLQSLMHRIDSTIKRQPPRIGLSATLGDMQLAADFLRPLASTSVQVIESPSNDRELRILIKGYVDKVPELNDNDTLEALTTYDKIAQHLFKNLRGSNNLIFPNTRGLVEKYAYHLRKLCDEAQVANEFWPHHGSLSRELREETEAALKNKERPATAVCTNTLELGIDIGNIKSILQIGSPPSVASLRQRLGRSGRRKGEPAILRGYIIEQEITDASHPITELREGLFEMVAMVSLLLEGWFEPPRVHGLHASTFVQQLMALIAQRGGIFAAEAFHVLCTTGPFSAIDKRDYLTLLRHLGQEKLIVQDNSGVLLHGVKGEALVNHYTFYAAFAAEEEFRVVSNNQTLGSLPIASSMSTGDFILFAAKTWRVDAIHDDNKTIFVTKHSTGTVPAFNSRSGMIHNKVRLRMRELYESTSNIIFLDHQAIELLKEGRDGYKRLDLNHRSLVSIGKSTWLFTWLGDDINQALSGMLRCAGIKSIPCGAALEIYATQALVCECLKKIALAKVPNADKLLNDVRNIRREKWDGSIPESLLRKSYASLHLDIHGAHQWITENIDNLWAGLSQ